jgi:hypothetical protein
MDTLSAFVANLPHGGARRLALGADGTIIPVANPLPGQHATILQLPLVTQVDNKADVKAGTNFEAAL